MLYCTLVRHPEDIMDSTEGISSPWICSRWTNPYIYWAFQTFQMQMTFEIHIFFSLIHYNLWRSTNLSGMSAAKTKAMQSHKRRPASHVNPLPLCVCVCVLEIRFYSWQQEFSPSFCYNWELQWCKIMQGCCFEKFTQGCRHEISLHHQATNLQSLL